MYWRKYRLDNYRGHATRTYHNTHISFYYNQPDWEVRWDELAHTDFILRMDMRMLKEDDSFTPYEHYEFDETGRGYVYDTNWPLDNARYGISTSRKRWPYGGVAWDRKRIRQLKLDCMNNLIYYRDVWGNEWKEEWGVPCPFMTGRHARDLIPFVYEDATGRLL